MKLPNRKNAIIRREKFTKYLLSQTHRDGKSKAKFLNIIGFNYTNIDMLEHALLEIGRSNEVKEVDKRKKKIVIKYVINGVIDAPNGNKYNVMTVWAIDAGSKIPHLTTIRPIPVV
ncbi:MAG: DUF6883 domain-containing protein [Patescibacteria group bacterium]